MKRFFVFMIVCVFFSCSTKKAGLSIERGVQTWHYTRGKVALILGHGYNDKEWASQLKSKLEAKYGLSDNGGLIFLLVYPDDFMHGSSSHISRLFKLLDGRDLEGIVILGAPEGTEKALTKISATYGGSLPCGVINLFSQDSVLGMEHFSTVMVDKFALSTLDDINTEQSIERAENAEEMIFRSIHLLTSYSEFQSDSSLMGIAKYITGHNEIHRYEDPVTSLTSVNHFVME